ncbi:MAG: DoxX family protein [Deltaproteobacteria bacterium]|nr:DoxX family protein [Deltaproteobacteria bacterium]MBW1921102.1 DoxX family protein [Deltaproteobacteria bacterium]MBW1935957.1 DoxX family protein [Deltaproteobacteria bacterium]MBW1979312.1 DoxX family protein [Deltaproteobacteria bacterium]MBW2045694.1 DoxX family protein [Deltaproteobacteria bacterium]
MLKEFLKTDKSPAQLLIRIALGVVIFPHGAQKVFGWFGGAGYVKTIHAFSGMGFPAWATVILMFTETVGAALLIGGFLTRVWAFGIGIAITICVFVNHLQYGFFMNWFGQQKGEGYEYHILVIGIVLALIIRGGGLFSVDGKLAPDRYRRSYLL